MKKVILTVNEYWAKFLNVEEDIELDGEYLGLGYSGDLEEGLCTTLIISLETGEVVEVGDYKQIRFIK